MLEAAWWGFVGGAALLLGAAMGIWLRVSHRTVGLVMGFGAGVLFSAVAFELTIEAYQAAGATPVVLGLLAGALAFFLGDWWLDNHGAHRRKSPAGPQPDAAAMALVLGALLDGIPESAAIGVSLVEGSEVGLAIVAAVFISNVPEAMSASAGLRATGSSVRSILGLWSLVVVAGVVAAMLGFGVFGSADVTVVAAVQAFAAGAMLTMIADTMLPEAVHNAHRWVGLMTAGGFVLAFLLSAA